MKSKSTYVSRHRQRRQRMGVRRLEIAVKAKDAPLLKSIASTLRAEGPEADRLRSMLRRVPAVSRPTTGAELLAVLRAGELFGDEVEFARSKSSRAPLSLE